MYAVRYGDQGSDTPARVTVQGPTGRSWWIQYDDVRTASQVADVLATAIRREPEHAEDIAHAWYEMHGRE